VPGQQLGWQLLAKLPSLNLAALLSRWPLLALESLGPAAACQRSDAEAEAKQPSSPIQQERCLISGTCQYCRRRCWGRRWIRRRRWRWRWRWRDCIADSQKSRGGNAGICTNPPQTASRVCQGPIIVIRKVLEIRAREAPYGLSTLVNCRYALVGRSGIRVTGQDTRSIRQRPPSTCHRRPRW